MVMVICGDGWIVFAQMGKWRKSIDERDFKLSLKKTEADELLKQKDFWHLRSEWLEAKQEVYPSRNEADNKVYELVENGIKRRGFKRFLMVTFQGQFIKGDHLIYQCAGWWLDENNTPAKWDNMTVFGVGNKAVFKLSASQKRNKVPQHLLDRQ